jgi:hypothetical protein
MPASSSRSTGRARSISAGPLLSRASSWSVSSSSPSRPRRRSAIMRTRASSEAPSTRCKGVVRSSRSSGLRVGRLHDVVVSSFAGRQESGRSVGARLSRVPAPRLRPLLVPDAMDRGDLRLARRKGWRSAAVVVCFTAAGRPGSARVLWAPWSCRVLLSQRVDPALESPSFACHQLGIAERVG